MNFIDFFEKSARLYPSRDCIIFGQRRWTYSQVDELANRIANGLRGQGAGPETKCAVLSRNDPIAFITMLGILKAGAVWVPLNSTNAPAQNLHVVGYFDVEVLFFEKEAEAFVQQVKAEFPAVKSFYCVDDSSELGPCVEVWAMLQSSEYRPLPWAPDALCWLRGTGGTTGMPKGVVVTHRNLVAGATSVAILPPMTGG